MKVITLNLHCFAEENQKEKITRVAKWITENEIDICLLQEVAQDQKNPILFNNIRRENLAYELFLLLDGPYHFCYQPIKTGYGHLDEGLAVITRYHIISDKLTYISKTTDYSNWICRAAYETDVVASRPIRLFTTHLGWDMMGETFKEQYAKMSELIKASPYFTIVAGDFNHIHGSEEYKMICDTGLYNVSDIFGADPKKYPTFHKELDSNTFNTNDHFVSSPNRMIDFIMVNEPVEVHDFRIVFDKEEDYVSDHNLVYTEFTYKGEKK